jgi:hypothetical protein
MVDEIVENSRVKVNEMKALPPVNSGNNRSIVDVVGGQWATVNWQDLLLGIVGKGWVGWASLWQSMKYMTSHKPSSRTQANLTCKCFGILIRNIMALEHICDLYCTVTMRR